MAEKAKALQLPPGITNPTNIDTKEILELSKYILMIIGQNRIKRKNIFGVNRAIKGRLNFKLPADQGEKSSLIGGPHIYASYYLRKLLFALD